MSREYSKKGRRLALLALCLVAGLWILALPAASASAAPSSWWQVLPGARPTYLPPGGSGRLLLTVTNLGHAPVDATKDTVTITDRLPEGAVATEAEGFAGLLGLAGPVDCSIEAGGTLVTCTFEETLPSYEAIEIEITVDAPAQAGAPGEVVVSGGKTPTESAQQPIVVSSEPVPFGFERFSVQAEEEGGAPTTQAGRHPFQLTTTLQLNSGPLVGAATRRLATVEQPALPRNLRFPLPAGLVGNTAAMPQCDMAEFYSLAGLSCGPETAIGVASVTIVESLFLGLSRVAVPVFNLPPAQGEPARFGFSVKNAPVVIETQVDPENDYRIVASVRNTSQIAQFLSSTVVLWGTPGDPRHDGARGWECSSEKTGPCGPLPTLSQTAFLRQPVSCDRPLDFDAEIEPWNVPLGSTVARASFEGPALGGCGKIPFHPEVAASPTSRLAANPSGLDFSLEMPNFGLDSPDAVSEGHAKKVTVTLPEGMTVNPSQAEGLAVCSPAQYARERVDSAAGEGCPEASKIGEVQISTPLLKEQARGSIYVAKPYDNPFDSLLALYMVARIPERGILVKQAGRVALDPGTGRIETTFDNLPQLPFSSFDLHFREGGRAPLVTPPACGTYPIRTEFVPWSASDPENPLPSEIVTRTSSFTVERGVDGGACPKGGLPPFKPELLAGAVNNAAGAFSPFNVRITRKDGEQELTNFSIKLPPGVAAKLAGVPFCSDAQIARAISRTGPHGGQEEILDPSCPAASQVGRTLAGAGVGQVLAYAPGGIYLAGPYRGAPISLVAITSGVVGPFDIGTIVVRLAIKVHPETGEVFLDSTGSDPIPHIVKGVALHLRDVRAYTDRPGFTFNPTSCEPTSTSATVLGSGLDFVSRADDNPFVSTSPFQAADCAALPFKPKLTLRLKGATRRAGNPALRAHLAMNGFGESGLAYARVALPRALFIDNAHIDTVCTRVQFRQGAVEGEKCPRGSMIGRAKAVTPILDQPLQGPIYLRSNPERELPDIAASLNGQQISIVAVGHIDSAKGGGLRSTFEVIPDAPISSVDIDLFGGKRALIVSSRNLCSFKPRAKVEFKGHNGKRAAYPKLALKVPGCKKKGKKKAARRGR